MVGRDEDGGVAAFDHAIMEEDAESAGGGGGVGELLVGDSLADDSFKIRTGVLVVIDGELGLSD